MKSTTQIPVVPNQWNWAEVASENLGEGIERQMIIGEKLMVCRLTMSPHVVTPAHDHSHEQITLVERGRVRFIIGDDDLIAKEGDILFFPSGCWHGATMLDEEVVLIDIFTPIREDFLGQANSGNGSSS